MTVIKATRIIDYEKLGLKKGDYVNISKARWYDYIDWNTIERKNIDKPPSLRLKELIDILDEEELNRFNNARIKVGAPK